MKSASAACLVSTTAVVLLLASAASASFWDTIPVVSQIKSAVQAIGGDSEAARQTQINFANQMPVVSQIKSAVEAATGDEEAARRTQIHFLKNAETVVDGTPVVGHIKGGIHMLAGDKERGLDIIRGATSTTGAVVGGVLGGPAGAIAGGLAADTMISSVDTAVAAANGEQDLFRPYGMIDYVANIDKKSVGEHFDVITGMGVDVAGGMMANKKSSSKPTSTRFGAGEGGGGGSSPSRPVANTVAEAAHRPDPAVQAHPAAADRRPGVTTVIRDGVEVHADRVVVKDGVEVNKFDGLLEVQRPDIRIMDAEAEYKALRPKPGDVPFKSVVAELDSPMVERNLHPAKFDPTAQALAGRGPGYRWFTSLTGLDIGYLGRTRLTDFRVINDVVGTTNCYFCTAAAFKGCSVSTLTAAYHIEPMHVWNAASVATMLDVFKRIGLSGTTYRRFADRAALMGHLDAAIAPGNKASYALAYVHEDGGHVVSLRAWKDKAVDSTVGTLISDYQAPLPGRPFSDRFKPAVPVSDQYYLFTFEKQYFDTEPFNGQKLSGDNSVKRIATTDIESPDVAKRRLG